MQLHAASLAGRPAVWWLNTNRCGAFLTNVSLNGARKNGDEKVLSQVLIRDSQPF